MSMRKNTVKPLWYFHFIAEHGNLYMMPEYKIIQVKLECFRFWLRALLLAEVLGLNPGMPVGPWAGEASALPATGLAPPLCFLLLMKSIKYD